MKPTEPNLDGLVKKLQSNSKSMLPILLGAIAISGLVYLLSEDKKQPKKMKSSSSANLHDLFLEFDEYLQLTPGRRNKLIKSRKAIQQKIVNYFKQHPYLPTPRFYIQGSYKMQTMALDAYGSHDVDLGIYFLSKPNYTAYTMQDYVLRAVMNHNETPPEHRERCVRLIYQGEYNIDLTIYYKRPTDSHPYLATKKGWIKSDPKELCDWFKGKTDRDEQLVRMVRYFKGWANNNRKKMPSGIALTVWMANHFKPDKRDDKAFYNSIKAISETIGRSVACINPACPGDDLIRRLGSDQKSHFRQALTQLIKNAEQAMATNSQSLASKIWQRQFGEGFPIT